MNAAATASTKANDGVLDALVDAAADQERPGQGEDGVEHDEPEAEPSGTRYGRRKLASRNRPVPSSADSAARSTRWSSSAGGSFSSRASSSGVALSGHAGAAAARAPPGPTRPLDHRRPVPAPPAGRGRRQAEVVTAGPVLVVVLAAPRGSSSSGTGQQRAVERRAAEQLLVGALGDEPAAVDHHDAVGQPQRRPAMGDEQRRPAPRAASRATTWISSSVVASTADVASSSTSTRGSVSSVRASAMRCRCPPESVRPRSPTTVS